MTAPRARPPSAEVLAQEAESILSRAQGIDYVLIVGDDGDVIRCASNGNWALGAMHRFQRVIERRDEQRSEDSDLDWEPK